MSFRDQVLNDPRLGSGLSLTEAKTRHDRLANLPPELFELAELQAGKGASFAAKLEALVAGMQSLFLEVQKAEAAAPAPKPSAASAQKGKVDPAVNEGAKASETLRPDVALAALADALALAEGIPYGEALRLACERDPELAKRYHEANFGAPATTSPSDRPDIQLAAAAKTLAEERSIPYGEALTVALAEDPALAKRYQGA